MNHVLNWEGWLCTRVLRRNVYLPYLPQMSSCASSLASYTTVLIGADTFGAQRLRGSSWDSSVLGSCHHSSHGDENPWDVSSLHNVITVSLYVSMITGKVIWWTRIKFPSTSCGNLSGWPQYNKSFQDYKLIQLLEGDWKAAKKCNMIWSCYCNKMYMFQVKVFIEICMCMIENFCMDLTEINHSI